MNHTDHLISLVHKLVKTQECGWLEFKQNNAKKEEIGKYISALSNSALLSGKDKGYVLWGVTNDPRNIVGTDFDPAKYKVGNEELENWLLQHLTPKINFRFHQTRIEEKAVIILEIDAAYRQPTSFTNEEYVRIGSYCKKLRGFSEKERELWKLLDKTPFEVQLACEHINEEKVLDLLDYSSYFNLIQMPVPDGQLAILETLMKEEMVQKNATGNYDITNLGAILLAKDLNEFAGLKRKEVRVIKYKSNNRTNTITERDGKKGYAADFEDLIKYIMTQITKENMDSSIRKKEPMLPNIAVREVVANALIHQDFFETGSGAMIEIFADRLEITNPGLPLVDVDRFLDAPPKSRNEKLASLMRRMGICEERGVRSR